MLSRAAVDKISVGTAKYGATETCSASEVFQDVGLPVFFWLYQLQHIHMPGLDINGGHRGISMEGTDPSLMAVHDINPARDEDCSGHKDWPINLKYDQAVSIGCGKIGTSGPYHNSTKHTDMYDAFAWFAKNGKKVSVGIENLNDFIKVTNNDVSRIVP